MKLRFATCNNVPVSRGVQHNLDSLHRTILLNAHNGVNRTRQPFGGLLDRELRPPPNSRRDCRMMRVKDYLH
jgi:hypothetical protein